MFAVMTKTEILFFFAAIEEIRRLARNTPRLVFSKLHKNTPHTDTGKHAATCCKHAVFFVRLKVPTPELSQNAMSGIEHLPVESVGTIIG